MKKTLQLIGLLLLVIIVSTAVVLTVDYLKSKITEEGLSGWFATSETIIGASTNLKTLPREAVNGNSTTTPPTGEYSMLDGGATVTQRIDTNDKESVILNIMAKADTATSTLFIRQLGSHDGTNFFNLATTTQDYLSANQVTTSTINAVPILATQWDPGTATTSISRLFDTYGYRWTRFVVWGENLLADTTDGVQAWITAVPVETKH